MSTVSVRIQLRYPDEESFIADYAPNLNHAGIFIQSRVPENVGTELKFEIRLQENEPILVGRGVVVWSSSYDSDDPGAAHGMGIRFDRVSEESLALLQRVAAHKNEPERTVEDALAALQREVEGRRANRRASGVFARLLAEATGEYPTIRMGNEVSAEVSADAGEDNPSEDDAPVISPQLEVTKTIAEPTQSVSGDNDAELQRLIIEAQLSEEAIERALAYARQTGATSDDAQLEQLLGESFEPPANALERLGLGTVSDVVDNREALPEARALELKAVELPEITSPAEPASPVAAAPEPQAYFPDSDTGQTASPEVLDSEVLQASVADETAPARLQETSDDLAAEDDSVQIGLAESSPLQDALAAHAESNASELHATADALGPLDQLAAQDQASTEPEEAVTTPRRPSFAFEPGDADVEADAGAAPPEIPDGEELPFEQHDVAIADDDDVELLDADLMIEEDDEHDQAILTSAPPPPPDTPAPGGLVEQDSLDVDISFDAPTDAPEDARSAKATVQMSPSGMYNDDADEPTQLSEPPMDDFDEDGIEPDDELEFETPPANLETTQRDDNQAAADADPDAEEDPGSDKKRRRKRPALARLFGKK